ncbi:MAG: 4-hydroxy-tetrahydrodipicolinate reductase [Cyclobacteriaceae bacterium]|nr:MAG: 4-hydroxy-tetrahydrodipicolinate reductase [Cyclobacteriaceae bacterium]
MKIALIGYGKMGKAIEALALKRGHEITARITSTPMLKAAMFQADVAIEFSRPEAAFANITWCLQHNLPVVCGTTGWLDRLPEAEKLTTQVNGTFFYASNFSIGVNIFFRVNAFLAKLMAHQPEYRVSIEEIHHAQKKDAPSGTAIKLAQDIMAQVPGLKKWALQEQGSPEVLPISAVRTATVPGTHTVTWQSELDTLTLRHEAHTREAFARGALAVAEWLPGKKGVLSMNDFLQL